MLRFLLPLRFVMLLAAFGAGVGALLMFGLGCFKLAGAVGSAFAGEATVQGITGAVLAATDAYLFGVVLVIFAYAIAFGFVFELSEEARARLPGWMRVGGVAELKHTLVEVILVYLVVEFATDVAQADDHLPWNALVMPAAVALIAAAMRLLSGRAGPAGHG